MLAALVAGLVALSYAELGSMYPRAGVEYDFLSQAVRNRLIPYLVGWVLTLNGSASVTTLALGFAQYLNLIWPIEAWLAAILLITLLTIAVLLGLRLDTRINLVFTAIEAGGLIIDGAHWLVTPGAGTRSPTHSCSLDRHHYCGNCSSATPSSRSSEGSWQHKQLECIGGLRGCQHDPNHLTLPAARCHQAVQGSVQHWKVPCFDCVVIARHVRIKLTVSVANHRTGAGSGCAGRNSLSVPSEEDLGASWTISQKKLKGRVTASQDIKL